MVKRIIHDGDIFEPDLLDEYQIDQANDIAKVKRKNLLSGEEDEGFDYRVSFVGFVTNKENDFLVVLPKRYRIDANSFNQDCSILFKCISRYYQRKKTTYLGSKKGDEWSSNYPFSPFFGVYDYYLKYGLYFDKQDALNQRTGGRIDWKSTIRLSKKYIANNKIVMFPFLRKVSVSAETFLTICMAFIIDYTAEKFGSFINIDTIEYEIPRIDLNSGRKRILDELLRLKKKVFDDEKISLIQNMIEFFSQLNEGGSYYLKHYNFAAIWEDVSRHYVSNHFDGVSSLGSIELSLCEKPKKSFDKPSFNPNLFKPDEFIQPDCYFVEDNIQYVLDAKYYLNIGGIMYKELSYLFLLTNYRDSLSANPKYKKTVGALLLPSDHRETKINFKMDPLYNKEFSEITLFEEYLDIKDVILYYIR